MKEMKTINIKGKEYVTVNERIKAFRNTYKNYSLITDIVEISDTHCVMKASILDPQGKIVATGYAREIVSKSPINKFAFVENAETSAWGRALGNFGIGVDTAICSAEELLVKINSEEPQKEELSLDILQIGKIGSCRNADELAKVCQDISKELRKEEPKYRKSLVSAYKKKLEEFK